MANATANSPFVWKMRNGTEAIPIGKRDPFRAARGIFWWLLASAGFWGVLALVVFSI